MRFPTHAGRAGSLYPASRPAAGRVSPAALPIAQEADATMTPDGWGADYSAPELPASRPPRASNPGPGEPERAEAPAASPG